ncbi:MAG: ROK family protein, partial [Candidatus Limnocylindria bacterium]
ARAALDGADLALHDVVAAGCSAPGPLDHVRGIVHEAPNIPGLVDYPLADRLAAGMDGLPVFVDRDTAMAAIGEAVAGAARGVDDFVYVTVSTGLGGAIVSGGRMIRGAAGTAGEIGHWPVALESPRCGCGSFGCAESFAGGRNLAQQFGTADAEDVYRAAARGDGRARALVEHAEAALGSLAVGLVNALNPSRIVVGGSVAEHQSAHVLEPMRRAIATRAFRVPAGAVSVMPAALGADVGMLGAVLEARERAAGRGHWFL